MRGRFTARGRTHFGLIAIGVASFSCPSPSAKAEPGGTPASDPVPAPGPSVSSTDDFDLSARASTNMRLFQRALLPGPGGAIVEDQTLLPLHQSLSFQGSRIDTPLGKDSLEMQVATNGQLYLGAPEDLPPGNWDVSSAFLRQRYQSMSLALGRQPIVGGAARYSRVDGAQLQLQLPFNTELAIYGGWTVLPRWNERYGYSYLGDAYEDWVRPGEALPEPTRGEHWMTGVSGKWRDTKLGSFGFSYHYQAEDKSLNDSTLGVSGSVTALPDWDLRAEALFSTEQRRFSDLRASASWDALRTEDTAWIASAELLHTVPSLLLSQASVFSVFSYEEITEVGGGLQGRLPLRFRITADARAQVYNEGRAGTRLALGTNWKSDDEGTFFVRLDTGRVSTVDNGYWMLRSALAYRFLPTYRLSVDAYQYLYDREIQGRRTSSFYAAHLTYDPQDFWNARLGGSLTQSPYAALDAQLLAQLSINWDKERPQ